MLYSVKLNYSVFIDANNQQDAYRRAKTMIGSNPEMVINRIEQGSGKKKRSVVNMLIFGA